MPKSTTDGWLQQVANWTLSVAERAARRIPGVSSRWGTVTRDRTQEPAIALTFDDSPSADTTPRIMDVLERHGARACFFVVGSLSEKQASIRQDILRRGHDVGNYTHSHPPLNRCTTAECQREIGLFSEANGHRPFFVLPMAGSLHTFVGSSVKADIRSSAGTWIPWIWCSL
jgi:peptidoglycan/xylan/chitin deacetylase (PgdA/CDA1 family)